MQSTFLDSYDRVVIGSGLAGLTSGYTALQAGQNVLVLERAHRAGGVIRSENRDGYLLEYGPNTVQPTAELMQLIEALHLTKQVRLTSAQTPRFIRYQNRLVELPLSPMSFLTTDLLSIKGRLRVLIEPFIPRRENNNESLLNFVRRRLGTEAAERLVAPFVSGVWAGDAAQLSAADAFPRLAEWENHEGSLLSGLLKKKSASSVPKGLLSFDEGLETLVQALASALGGSLRMGSMVLGLQPPEKNGTSQWEVNVNGSVVKTDSVVLACPAPEAAALVRPFYPEASRALEEISYAPVAVLHLGFPEARVKSKLKGFGYLNAPSEKSDVLGCLWSSSLFADRAPKNAVLLTLFMGGASRPDLMEFSELDLVRRALTELEKTISVSGNPIFVSLTRYKRAIPQYTIGHGTRMNMLVDMEKRFSGLTLVGNYRGGISVGDVIQNSFCESAKSSSAFMNVG